MRDFQGCGLVLLPTIYSSRNSDRHWRYILSVSSPLPQSIEEVELPHCHTVSSDAIMPHGRSDRPVLAELGLSEPN
jgi:hypothetical protein